MSSHVRCSWFWEGQYRKQLARLYRSQERRPESQPQSPARRQAALPSTRLVARAVESHRDYLAREVLATSLRLNDRDGRDGPLAEATVRIAGEEVRQLLWR